MPGRDSLPMRMVLSQLIEHASWASRSWVDATMHAMAEAIREANFADCDLARRLDVAESSPDGDDRDHALVEALQSRPADDELRALCLRFLKLREQFRPIWSEERAVQAIPLRPRGGLIAVHRR